MREESGVVIGRWPYSFLLLTRVLLSMSWKGNCYDNVPVENFFGSLKNELARHRPFFDQPEVRQAIGEYIEEFYNRQRVHQALGYRSPEEFEKMASES
jgi:putative transposase